MCLGRVIQNVNGAAREHALWELLEDVHVAVLLFFVLWWSSLAVSKLEIGKLVISFVGGEVSSQRRTARLALKEACPGC